MKLRRVLAPHLEYMPLDCSNCGGQKFTIAVSPLKNELKTAAVLRGIKCITCNALYNIEDGIVGGKVNQ